jgi:phosphatidylglycerol:prolipoprotein diacylglycerol transferase
MYYSLAILFPHIDPVAISIGPIDIRWYALAYVTGIVLGCYYVGFLAKKQAHNVTKAILDDLMTYIIFGIIIGGRLGYAIFYNPNYYISHPLEVLFTWQGGMSFHGGLIGAIVSVYLLCRKHKIAFFTITDLIACASPIGIFLGRIANFINGELYGRVTGMPWGVIFPGGGNLPRHPSQLYEAFSEGLVTFIILNILIYQTKALDKPGLMSGMFLLLYSVSRITVENFREPDAHIGFIFGSLTVGQILSSAMLISGIYIIYRANKHTSAK